MLDVESRCDGGDGRQGEGEDGREEERENWRWGGLMLGEEGVPVCKHLLACLLGERMGMGGEIVEERVVGREEFAGWAAGWGG